MFYVLILIQIKFVSDDTINNKTTSIQVIAWRHISYLTLCAVIGLQWVNFMAAGSFLRLRLYFKQTHPIIIIWKGKENPNKIFIVAFTLFKRFKPQQYVSSCSTLLWRHNDHNGVTNHQPHGLYSTVDSDADQRKHQSSVSLAFVLGIHRDRWIPRTKGQLRGKCFHLMTSLWPPAKFWQV